MITKIVENGSASSTVNGITKTIPWSSPGTLNPPESSGYAGGFGIGISEIPNPNSTYYLSSHGTVTLTISWVYPDGTPAPNPTRNVTLALTPYAQAYADETCSCTVDDGYGDPAIPVFGTGGLYSGDTYLKGNLMPHTELIPLTATNGTATYTTPNMSATLQAIASYNDLNAQDASAFNQLNIAIDNRAIVVGRTTPAINQWFSPSDVYTFHGDTTYGWTSITTSTGYPTVTTYNSNWQSFQPAFLGNWKSTPPVSYTWTPNESQDTWDSALWDIADGGQTESNDDIGVEDDWTASPTPMSGTMQYTATDSDNATFTGEYDMNIHPMVEPMSNLMHQVWSDPVAFGDPNNGLNIVVKGPMYSPPTYSYGTTLGQTYTLQISSGVPIEQLAQCFGITFPGTVAGSLGYTSSVTSTIGPGGWPNGGISANEVAYIAEQAQWDRFVFDYRSFSPPGESILWNSSNQAVAHRTVCDEGPISDPSLFWKVVPKNTPIPLPGVMSDPPISEDTQMPAPYLYDPHTP